MIRGMIARQITRLAAVRPLRMCNMCICQKRTFATKPEKPNKPAISKLMSSVQVAYENEKKEKAIESNTEEILKRHGFTKTEAKDSSKIILTKKLDKFELEISFYSRDIEIAEKPEQQPKVGEKQENEDELIIPLQIKIEDKEGDGFMIEAAIEGGEIELSAIVSLKNYDNLRKSSTLDKGNEYLGPCFHNIGENMQAGFVDWLNDIGANGEVLSCVPDLYLEKEQKLYMKWLTEVQRLLSKFE